MGFLWATLQSTSDSSNMDWNIIMEDKLWDIKFMKENFKEVEGKDLGLGIHLPWLKEENLKISW